MTKASQTIAEIVDFMKSDERCLLLTGTNSPDKLKLLMARLSVVCRDKNILMRLNPLNRIGLIIGWAGVKVPPPTSAAKKLLNNNYHFDDMLITNTWHKARNNYDVGILYPAEDMLTKGAFEAVADIFTKKIPKIFLLTHQDPAGGDYSKLNEYVSRRVIYDLEG
ncbi:MAG: hypothetical protein FWB71_05450 [Defluviitaleaceae bacterium]|nr:hypothetical protein [Defluviitaleaceae bacterium]